LGRSREDSALHHKSLLSVSHAARCVAWNGVRSHPVPVALVGARLAFQ